MPDVVEFAVRWAKRTAMVAGAFAALYVVLVTLLTVWSILGRPPAGTADLVAQGGLLVDGVMLPLTVVLAGANVMSSVVSSRVAGAAGEANRLAADAAAAADRRALAEEVAAHVSLLTAAAAAAVRHGSEYVNLRPLRAWLVVARRTQRMWGAAAALNAALGDATVAAARLRIVGEPAVAAAADEYVKALAVYHRAVLDDPAKVPGAELRLGDVQRRVESAASAVRSRSGHVPSGSVAGTGLSTGMSCAAGAGGGPGRPWLSEGAVIMEGCPWTRHSGFCCGRGTPAGAPCAAPTSPSRTTPPGP